MPGICGLLFVWNFYFKNQTKIHKSWRKDANWKFRIQMFLMKEFHGKHINFANWVVFFLYLLSLSAAASFLFYFFFYYFCGFNLNYFIVFLFLSFGTFSSLYVCVLCKYILLWDFCFLFLVVFHFIILPAVVGFHMYLQQNYLVLLAYLH